MDRWELEQHKLMQKTTHELKDIARDENIILGYASAQKELIAKEIVVWRKKREEERQATHDELMRQELPYGRIRVSSPNSDRIVEFTVCEYCENLNQDMWYCNLINCPVNPDDFCSLDGDTVWS